MNAKNAFGFLLVVIVICLLIVISRQEHDGSMGTWDKYEDPNCNYVEVYPGDTDGHWDCYDQPVRHRHLPAPTPTPKPTKEAFILTTPVIIYGQNAALYPTPTPAL